MARYGISVDLNRCTGCMTCVIACKEENLTRPGVWWNRILEMENETLDNIIYFRNACMHCDNPPCVESCAAGAFYKRPDGLVLIDQDKCVGAGDCVDACPYGVIDINPDQDYFPGQTLPYEEIPYAHRIHPPGKSSKCTMCNHRIEQGKEPVCVEACPSKSMVFGDLDDPDSPAYKKLGISEQLLESEDAKPKVSYIIPMNLLNRINQRIKNNPKMVR
ncbi:MAG: 4Fe-4S dicluster domain-containing protein [Pseudomonadota bacterium]